MKRLGSGVNKHGAQGRFQQKVGQVMTAVFSSQGCHSSLGISSVPWWTMREHQMLLG
jgi:hypothetical protein